MYNFDKIIDRKDSLAVRWHNTDDDTISLLIADMDFVAPKEVFEAIRQRLNHEILGYSVMDDEFYNVFIEWMKKRYNYEVKREWIVVTPNVVSSLGLSISAYTQNSGGVLIMPPVYPQFLNIPSKQGLKRIDVPLLYSENKNKYYIDFDLFSKKASEADIFILCSPHNPVGRVWTKEELERIADIVLQNDIILVSDEIYSDIIMPDYKHTPMGSISKELYNNLISIYAPNKTFNIAGVPTGYNIIPNEKLREKFLDTMVASGVVVDQQNIASNIAAKAAYKHGEPWLNEVICYLHENYIYLKKYIEANIPKVKMTEVEGTFLAWLDFRELGLSHEELEKLLIQNAKVMLKTGVDLDNEKGQCFMRLNFATQRSVLKEALERIKNMIDSL